MKTLLLPPRRPERKYIFGMIPWMFWTLLAVVAFTLFAPFIARAFAEEQTTGVLPAPQASLPIPSLTSKNANLITGETWTPSTLKISAGHGAIEINLKTGQVDLPKDMTLPDAAVAFWLRVAQCFPECRQAMLTGDPTPLTIKWLGRSGISRSYNPDIVYELGLRSDGVVVWKEVKP